MNQAIHLSFLFSFWYCFGTAILLTLVSFVASQKAFKHSQRMAYFYYIECKEEVAEQKNLPALITRYLTYSAGTSFLAALVMTLAFTTVNVRHLNAILQTAKIVPGVRMSDKSMRAGTGNDANRGVEPAGLIKVPSQQPLVVPPAPGGQSPPPSTTERK